MDWMIMILKILNDKLQAAFGKVDQQWTILECGSLSLFADKQMAILQVHINLFDWRKSWH